MLILYGIHIGTENDTLGFWENGSSVTVPLTTVNAETRLYAYRNAFSGDIPSLYDQLESAINASTSGTYHFEATTPDLSNGFVYSGIKIVRDSGSGEWGYDFDDAANEIDPRFFGFNGGKHTTTGDELSGHYSRYGVWQLPQQGAWGSFDGNATKEQFRNSARRPNAVVTRWGTDEMRSLEIKRVTAGHVRPYMNEDPDYADVSGLAQNDHGNAWYDVWDKGISSYKDMILIYPDGGRYVEDLALDAAGREWEVVYSHRQSQYAADLSSTMTQRNQNADVYDLEVGFGRIPADDSSVSSASYYRRRL